jgi:hypothetical protein
MPYTVNCISEWGDGYRPTAQPCRTQTLYGFLHPSVRGDQSIHFAAAAGEREGGAISSWRTHHRGGEGGSKSRSSHSARSRVSDSASLAYFDPPASPCQSARARRQD